MYFSIIIVVSALAVFAVISAHGYDVKQAIGDVILVLTGIVIAIYTYETYKLRKVTTESYISQNRPVLSFEGSTDNGGITGEGLGSISLKNSGSGSALGVRLSIRTSDISEELSGDYDPGVIPVGEVVRVGCSSEVYQNVLTKNKKKLPVIITIHYKDLAGIQYSTEVYLSKDTEQRPMKGDVVKVIVHDRLK